jgi:hypothetical protein
MRARSGRRIWPVVWYGTGGIALFFCYLRLSGTYAENSDMANTLLMGRDLLNGNLLLHGWRMSDVSFYPTELVRAACGCLPRPRPAGWCCAATWPGSATS